MNILLHFVNKKSPKLLRTLDTTSQTLCGTPAGVRTLDTLIKSQVLYQLSYGCIFFNSLHLSTPAGVRTLDTLIKSQVLYQLSYGCICSTEAVFQNASAKLLLFIGTAKLLSIFFLKNIFFYDYPILFYLFAFTSQVSLL